MEAGAQVGGGAAIPPGAVDEVAEGIVRLAIPVPYRGLGTVNCYLLREKDGWALLDTGLNTPDARTVWQVASEETGIAAADVRRILLTHHHPDHVGLAGWLQGCAQEAQEKAVPVFLSRRERELVRSWLQPETRAEQLRELFAKCGVPEAKQPAISSAELEQMLQATRPHPEHLKEVTAGDTMRLGARHFEALVLPGHSDGRLALYDREHRLLLIGDHVLGYITPNVSLWPTTGEDPLGRYLASLEELADLDVRRALPGHGPPIEDWEARLRSLRAHHEERLAFMGDAASAEATVYEVSQKAFDFDALSPEERRFAVAETLAHLEHLVRQGRLVRRNNGAWRYSKTADGGPRAAA